MDYFTKPLGITITLEKSTMRKREFNVPHEIKWHYRKIKKLSNVTEKLRQISGKVQNTKLHQLSPSLGYTWNNSSYF